MLSLSNPVYHEPVETTTGSYKLDDVAGRAKKVLQLGDSYELLMGSPLVTSTEHAARVIEGFASDYVRDASFAATQGSDLSIRVNPNLGVDLVVASTIQTEIGLSLPRYLELQNLVKRLLTLSQNRTYMKHVVDELVAFFGDAVISSDWDDVGYGSAAGAFFSAPTGGVILRQGGNAKVAYVVLKRGALGVYRNISVAFDTPNVRTFSQSYYTYSTGVPYTGIYTEAAFLAGAGINQIVRQAAYNVTVESLGYNPLAPHGVFNAFAERQLAIDFCDSVGLTIAPRTSAWMPLDAVTAEEKVLARSGAFSVTFSNVQLLPGVAMTSFGISTLVVTKLAFDELRTVYQFKTLLPMLPQDSEIRALLIDNPELSYISLESETWYDLDLKSRLAEGVEKHIQPLYSMAMEAEVDLRAEVLDAVNGITVGTASNYVKARTTTANQSMGWIVDGSWLVSGSEGSYQDWEQLDVWSLTISGILTGSGEGMQVVYNLATEEGLDAYGSVILARKTIVYGDLTTTGTFSELMLFQNVFGVAKEVVFTQFTSALEVGNYVNKSKLFIDLNDRSSSAAMTRYLLLKSSEDLGLSQCIRANNIMTWSVPRYVN